MSNLTKNYISGYFFLLLGLFFCSLNFFINQTEKTVFGSFPLYVISGFFSALGLTLVFKKGKGDDKDVTSNNN